MYVGHDFPCRLLGSDPKLPVESIFEVPGASKAHLDVVNGQSLKVTYLGELVRKQNRVQPTAFGSAGGRWGGRGMRPALDTLLKRTPRRDVTRARPPFAPPRADEDDPRR